MNEVFLVGGARTPMTDYSGALKDVSALELGAIAAKAAFERTGVKPEWIEHAVVGNVMQTSADAIYGARHVALKAGVPIEVPALTVNRLCGSGIQAAVSGAQMIQLGEADLVLSGGIESMSQAPHVLRGLRNGLRLNQGKLEDSLYEALLDPYCGLFMAQTAEKCAAKYNISRDEQDAYALRSQQAASARVGRRQVQGRSHAGRDQVAQGRDGRRQGRSPASGHDARRPRQTAGGLLEGRQRHRRQRQRHRRRRRGADSRAARRPSRTRSLKPLGRLVAWGIVGVEPSLMGMGPAPATRKALAKAGLTLSDIDLIEVNEAFAGQYLAVEKELGLDREKTNVNGGAIALGHPLGMTGTRLLLTLLLELGRRGRRYGVATACIGGGQGIAAIVERL